MVVGFEPSSKYPYASTPKKELLVTLCKVPEPSKPSYIETDTLISTL